MTFPGMSGDTTKEEKMNVLLRGRASEQDSERERESEGARELQAGGDDVAEEEGRLFLFFLLKKCYFLRNRVGVVTSGRPLQRHLWASSAALSAIRVACFSWV